MALLNGIISSGITSLSKSLYSFLGGYTKTTQYEESPHAAKGKDPVRSYLTWSDDSSTASAKGKLVFHVMESASHEFTSEVTQYPVEDGVAVSDHVQLSSPSFTVRAMFSDATYHMVAKSKESTGNSKQADVYATLQALRDARKTVTLRTPLGIYETLILTSISIAKSVQEGRSLFVDMSFQQIRKVSTATTSVDFTVKKKDLPKAAGGITKDSCAPKTLEGVKPTEIIPSPPTALDKAVGFIKGQATVGPLRF